jgi:DNA-binding PadR family transcriptional regulator
MNNHSLLGFALLGLLHHEPMSGYDLRKIFATTALGSFSDSPGAIYPALQRMEKQGWVRGEVQATGGMRRRRIFHPTPAGLVAFKVWLRKPVTRDDVIRRIGDLMLRFAFMDQMLGGEQAAKFLLAFAEELAAYIPTLKQYLKAHQKEMALSGRLALESGIWEYEARLRWARRAVKIYHQRHEHAQKERR